MGIIPGELTKGKFKDIWFEDRYEKLKKDLGEKSEPFEMIFRHLVWRIQELEATIQDKQKEDSESEPLPK